MTGKAGNVQGAASSDAMPKYRQSVAPRSSSPRASGPSRPRSLTIDTIKAHLTQSRVEALCRAWLPGGKLQGKWWVCCSPWRDDSNPSFGVSLSTGYWRDFATGEKGDMLDLSMRLYGGTVRETIMGLADMLGLQS